MSWYQKHLKKTLKASWKFVVGASWKSILKKASKMLLVFTVNPLSDRRGVEKINASYFRLGNLENCYQSVNHITQAVIISSNF